MKRVYDKALAIINEEIYQHDFISTLKRSDVQIKNEGRAMLLNTSHGTVKLVCMSLSNNADFMPKLEILQQLRDKIDAFFAKPNNQRSYTDHEALLNNSKKLNDILMKKSWFIECVDNTESLREFLKLSNISLENIIIKKFFDTCYSAYTNKLPTIVPDIEKAFSYCSHDRSYNMNSHTLYKENNTIYFSSLDTEVKITHVNDTYEVFAPVKSGWQIACVLHPDKVDIPRTIHFSALQMLPRLYEYINGINVNKKISMN